jgi:hypothetical protein
MNIRRKTRHEPGEHDGYQQERKNHKRICLPVNCSARRTGGSRGKVTEDPLLDGRHDIE